jgi:hypothetical protein
MEAANLLVEAEADASVRQALCGGLLRASEAAAAGVKRDRLEWLRGKADFVAGQAAAGQHAPLWELVRQLAGRRGGPRPIAVQHAADGRIMSRREELLARWEDPLAAEFSGHARTLACQESR